MACPILFLRAVQKIVVMSSERYPLKWALFFKARLNNIQSVKYASNIQYPQKVLPDTVARDFVTVEKMWKLNQESAVDSFLFHCFEKEKDCFSYALYLIYQAGVSKNENLAYSITHAFRLWQDNNCASEPLTIQLQTEALTAALSFKKDYIAQQVCDAFKISSQSDFVYEVIENHIAQKKFEEAAICILVLKMWEKFSVAKVLVPLVSQGKLNLVRMYVADSTALKLDLVKSLDDVLPFSKHQNLSTKMRKVMYKRLSNLLTSFKISPDNCPNLCEIHSKGTVNLLMHKRYSEQSISDVAWEEMITDSLRDSPSHQKKLIFRLVDVKDFAMAFKMAKKFEIPAEEWPSVLKSFDENTEMPNFSCHTETSQHVKLCDGSHKMKNFDVTEHLSLELDKSCLKYVETAEQFEDCLNDISKNHTIVGIDSEWKPNFSATKNRLALLQLAVEDSVYLMDILALNTRLKASHWDNLIESLFGNPEIIKLGCGLISDVDILVKSHRGTVGIPIRFSRLLDVSVLFQKFQFVCPDIVPDKEGIASYDSPMGLSKICSYVLGSPLKKEETFSDWEVRPLRDSQLYYAALDAYCLLQIYNKLEETGREKNLDFDGLVHSSIKRSSEPPKETSDLRKKLKWTKIDQGFEIQPLIDIKEFKVLLDCRLGNLGKELKFYGTDVLFLADTISCSEAVKIAQTEGRIILASSWLYQQLKGLISERFCYNIPNDFIVDTSSVAFIFQKFNVKMNSQAISFPDLNDS